MRYQKSLPRSLCVRCGKLPPMPDHSKCTYCQEKANQAARDRRREIREASITERDQFRPPGSCGFSLPIRKKFNSRGERIA